jgi:hypothetical protein
MWLFMRKNLPIQKNKKPARNQFYFNISAFVAKLNKTFFKPLLNFDINIEFQPKNSFNSCTFLILQNT